MMKIRQVPCVIYFNAYLLIPVIHLYICLFTLNGLSPKRARLKHQVSLLKVHFNLKRSKYHGNIVHIGLHIGSRSSSAFCDFIYYNITQNVQKTHFTLTLICKNIQILLAKVI